MKKYRTVVVMGSGGHTTEMIKLLSGCDLNIYTPRDYIVAETDKMSIQKIHNFDESKEKQIHLIKRSRHVGQSYLTSILTTLVAIFYSIPLVLTLKPEVLLVNGPGTCIPICGITWILSFLCINPKCKIIFVESICRVKSLSLSGKLLYHLRIADKCIVQWQELKDRYKRCEYLGQLV